MPGFEQGTQHQENTLQRAILAELEAVSIEPSKIGDTVDYITSRPKKSDLDALATRHGLDYGPLVERCLIQQAQAEILIEHTAQAETADDLGTCLGILYEFLGTSLDARTDTFQQFDMNNSGLAKASLNSASRVVARQPEALGDIAQSLARLWQLPRNWTNARRYTDNIMRLGGRLSTRSREDSANIEHDQAAIELLGSLSDLGALPERFWYNHGIKSSTGHDNPHFLAMVHWRMVVRALPVEPGSKYRPEDHIHDASKLLLNTLRTYRHDPARLQEHVCMPLKLLEGQRAGPNKELPLAKVTILANLAAKTVNEAGGIIISAPGMPEVRETLPQLDTSTLLNVAPALGNLLHLSRNRDDTQTYELHAKQDLRVQELITTLIERGLAQTSQTDSLDIINLPRFFADISAQEMEAVKRQLAAGRSLSYAVKHLQAQQERLTSESGQL